MTKPTEAVPYQLIEDLRYDIEVLKKKLSEPDDKINDLILQIDTFKQSLTELTTIFREALKETKEEEILTNKLEAVLKQNETIATGMLALVDKVDDLMKSRPNAPSVMPQPFMSSPQRMAPFPEPAGEPLPPPPLPGKKKMISSLF